MEQSGAYVVGTAQSIAAAEQGIGRASREIKSPCPPALIRISTLPARHKYKPSIFAKWREVRRKASKAQPTDRVSGV